MSDERRAAADRDRPSATVTVDAWTLTRARRARARRFDEAGEERVRIPRARAELRMELAGDEVGMLGQLDDLDELLLGPEARHAQPVLLEPRQVVVVDLVAVAVALLDDPLPVQPRGRACPRRGGSGRGPAASCRPCRRPCAARAAGRSPGAARRPRTPRSWRRPGRTRGGRTRSPRTACRGRCRRTARPARARSGPPRSCPRCRGRRSRPGPGCRGRRAKWAAAPSRSMCSASTHATSTRASLAMPPWASASMRLL